jgi:hypothetical protein
MVVRRRPEDADGWAVLDEGLARAEAVFGPRLQAAFAIGSLAHGGFAPAASDVDLALILDRVEPDDEAQMTGVKAEVRDRLGSPLAGRLSLFWSSWPDLERQSGAGRFPLADRQDLAVHGQRLQGDDQRHRVTLPQGVALRRGLVIEGAQFFLEKLAVPERDALLRDPAALVARGSREASKAVMFPVRFIYTLHEGRPAGNDEAAAFFARRPAGAIQDLARAALAWRRSGTLGPDAKELLAAGILPLHAEFGSGYAAALERFKEPALARAIAVWNSSLLSGDGKPVPF